jgi:hypothetical protein
MSLRLHFRTVPLAALIALVLTAATPASAGYLSNGELRALFPGRYVAVWKERINLTLIATANGMLAGGTWFRKDTGSWRVRGNELCITFSGWKKTRCGPVRKDGAWYLGLPRKDGTPRLRFRRQ